MSALGAWLRRLAGLFPSERRERELGAELEAHLQLHVDDNLRSGMEPEAARRAALLKLGGVEATKTAWREQSTLPIVENLLRDVRFAARQLRRNPGFGVTAGVMLALGIGASTAIFAFVDAALVEPLPYRDPQRLVSVYETHALCSQCPLSYLDYLDWKKLNSVFERLEAYQRNGLILNGASGAEAVRVALVSDGLLRALGAAPALGRDFAPGEDKPGAPRTVLLSHAAWQGRYAGGDVLGKTLMLDGAAYVVIGVLPQQFAFAPLEPAEFWVPLFGTGSCAERRSCHGVQAVARLKEGVSLQAALADVRGIAAQLEAQYPDSNRDQGASLSPLSETIVGSVRPVLLLLLGGSGLLLLIACLNVASLLLVRSESRRRELAVRGALGASRMRLMGQFVTEAFLLVGSGALVGLAVAVATMRLLRQLIPATVLVRMPFFHAVGLNGRVQCFAVSTATLAFVLLSITPMLRRSRSEPREDLAVGGRGSAGTTWRRLGAQLVVMELATAMVLLIAAGLLGQSFYRLLRVELGLRPDHLATAVVGVAESGHEKDEQLAVLARQVVDVASGLPGVSAAALTSILPLGTNGNTTWFRVLGRPFHGEHNDVPERAVTPGYLATLGATLVRGRGFGETDDASKPLVAVVNESFAKQYFPGEEPIGQHLAYLKDPPLPIEIVGVVKDVREGALDSGPRSVLYRPFAQTPDRSFAIVVRTSQDEHATLPLVAAALRRLDPGIVVDRELTMTDLIDASPSAYLHRSAAWLVGAFAALALLLSVVGLYGVIAYSVSQRTREIGVRMALGAERGAVCGLVLRESGRLSLLGIALGVVAAVGAGSLLRGLLFGVRSWDVPTFAAVAVVLGAAALLASYIPARRAASVNPVHALRTE